jgi:uncharacterized protein YecE (DUF72 family)
MDGPLRHAIEIRHQSFVCEAFIALLRDVTADFVYCRLHGSEVLYASGYGAQALDKWASSTWCLKTVITDVDELVDCVADSVGYQGLLANIAIRDMIIADCN